MLLTPSSRKKKLNLSCNIDSRSNNEDDDNILCKVFKSDNTNNSEDLKSSRRKNFVKACELVSQNAFINYAERLQLFHLPSCMDSNCCRHQIEVKKMASNAVETFNIDMTSGIWSEALEVGYLCITPTQYLSENVLKDIIEIMMNVHEDKSSAYTVKYLLDQCQMVLALNFSMHPPCLDKEIRTYYNKFLNSPMDLKRNTFTNRTEFGCENGIVKYCINRLESELSADSIDGPLIDKDLNTPAEMKESLRRLNWQKQKFEIFEMLQRPSRIERLMAVMHSISELFQYDLAIRHSRYTNNLGTHIRSYYRLLMGNFLWSNNYFFTGIITNVCKQIIRIFAYFVHLDYPDEYIRTMSLWINLMIETFYVSETKSNIDYPNTGKSCKALCQDFYNIISDLPGESIVKILLRIKPLYMRHLIGLHHTKTLLGTQEEDIIKILVNFIKNSQWKDFVKRDEVNVTMDLTVKKIKPNKYLKHFSKICKRPAITYEKKPRYPKFRNEEIETDAEVDQNHVIYTLYITIHAYLEAYNIQKVQEKLDDLNEALVTSENQEINDCTNKLNSSYNVTESFIKKYRSIYETLQELHLSLDTKRKNGELPNVLKIFENVLNLLR